MEQSKTRCSASVIDRCLHQIPRIPKDLTKFPWKTDLEMFSHQ